MRHFLVISMAFLLIAASAVGVKADNQAAAERIADALSEQFPQDEIDVLFLDGKLWLRGEMNSVAEMNRAVRYVKGLEGVQSVENEITLVKTTPTVTPVSARVPQRSTSSAPVPTHRPVVQTVPAPVTTAVGEVGREAVVTQTSTRVVRQLPNPAYAQEYEEEPYTAPAQQSYVTRGAQDYMGPGPAGAPAVGCRPNLPKYAWPSYAAHPNYAQVTYPKHYSAAAWPNIGPYYPYPKPPMGWRKVTMEWSDGHWWLDFDDGSAKGPFSPLFREPSRYR